MELTALEGRILGIVKEKTRSEGGVIQSVLWGVLGVDNREGTKAVLSLVRKGLIKREPIVFKGRRTYKLLYSPRTINKVEIIVSLNPVMNIPCFYCKELQRCGSGGYFNPYKCILLSRYIRGLS
ncbi:MAG: MarR family transcriptional regulator [Desulfurococcales archaeon ex4484_204]|nr:MAG: MarR family transcriptional regulator [Desulfurococcales archaeon ex4484_204]